VFDEPFCVLSSKLVQDSFSFNDGDRWTVTEDCPFSDVVLSHRAVVALPVFIVCVTCTVSLEDGGDRFNAGLVAAAVCAFCASLSFTGGPFWISF